MPHNPNRLEVVQRADALVERVHRLAAEYRQPLSELSPGLRSQLLRAATSISLNLGEACGYHQPRKAAALLDVSVGSCNEVERLLRLCQRLQALDVSVDAIIEEVCTVRKMTYGFRKRVLRPAPLSPAPLQPTPFRPTPLRPPTSEPDPASHLDHRPRSASDL